MRLACFNDRHPSVGIAADFFITWSSDLRRSEAISACMVTVIALRTLGNPICISGCTSYVAALDYWFRFKSTDRTIWL